MDKQPLDNAGGQTANLQSRITVRQIAKSFNVSERSMYLARRVLDLGVPELNQGVRAGVVSVSDAAAIVHLPHDAQRRALAIVQAGEAKTLRKAAELRGPTTLDKIKTLWGQATTEERAAFLRWLEVGAPRQAPQRSAVP